MAETRRERPQKPEDFTRETVIEIEGVRSIGAESAEDIATALNRSGYTSQAECREAGGEWQPGYGPPLPNPTSTGYFSGCGPQR